MTRDERILDDLSQHLREKIVTNISDYIVLCKSAGLDYPASMAELMCTLISLTAGEQAMKVYPFDEVCQEADKHVQQGRHVFQQFNCAHCGMKQTIDDANHFYTIGTCEECGKDTDMKKDGCNYMMIASLK